MKLARRMRASDNEHHGSARFRWSETFTTSFGVVSP
jgi:hypothetical protein